MREIVVACGLVAAVASGCSSDTGRSHAPLLSDPKEGPPPENAVALPAYPQQKDLLEFSAGPVGSHRYFIDKQSILVGADGIVRYSVVVRAAGGATNTTYEGLRCATRQKRLYAVGRADGKWVESKRSEWSEVRPWAPNEYQATLFTDFFCPGRLIVRDREAALRALQRGASRGPVFIE